MIEWKMGLSNISFLSFRVIFHWTMIMGERSLFFLLKCFVSDQAFHEKDCDSSTFGWHSKKCVPSLWALKMWVALSKQYIPHMRESCQAMNIKPIENLEKHPRPRTKPRWKTKKNQPQEPPTDRSWWWRFWWCWKVLMSDVPFQGTKVRIPYRGLPCHHLKQP